MSELNLTFVDYERSNTGRAYAHDEKTKMRAKLESRFTCQPEHPEASSSGYVCLLEIEGCNLTQAQAKELAKHLLRFARSGSILGARKKKG